MGVGELPIGEKAMHGGVAFGTQIDRGPRSSIDLARHEMMHRHSGFENADHANADAIFRTLFRFWSEGNFKCRACSSSKKVVTIGPPTRRCWQIRRRGTMPVEHCAAINRQIPNASRKCGVKLRWLLAFAIEDGAHGTFSARDASNSRPGRNFERRAAPNESRGLSTPARNRSCRACWSANSNNSCCSALESGLGNAGSRMFMACISHIASVSRLGKCKESEDWVQIFVDNHSGE